MGKRLVRAKDKIRQAGIPFRVPEREELAGRLDTVLEAIYAAFAEGWTDPAAPMSRAAISPRRRLFLARLVTDLLPEEPEALGLLALMLHAEARRARAARRGRRVCAARRAGSGVVGYADDRRGRGAAAARQRAGRRSAAISWKARCSRRTCIAAARAAPTGRRWCSCTMRCSRIAGSPVVAINRALAIAELHGAEAGLDAMPEAAADARLAEYQPYWAARAELLAKTGAMAKRGTRTRSPSVSNAIPRSGASCSGARGRWAGIDRFGIGGHRETCAYVL